MGLHMSISHIFLSSIGTSHGRTSSFSSTIRNSSFVGPFSRSFVWALWAFLLQYIVPAPTTKGTHLALFSKGLQVHTLCSRSTCKMNLNKHLPPFHHTIMGSDTTCWVSNNIINNINNPKQQSHIKTQNLCGKPFLFEEKIHGTNFESILLLSNQLQ